MYSSIKRRWTTAAVVVLAVSSAIVAAGAARAGTVQLAAMYTVTDLVPGASFAAATGMNSAGVVVGTFSLPTDPPGVVRAFRYADGALTELGTLPGFEQSTFATAINNRGEIVGSAEGSYGYLLKGDRFTRLDSLPAVQAKGWRHLEPAGINDRGWIVGTGVNASGDLRGFLLMPVLKAIRRKGG